MERLLSVSWCVSQPALMMLCATLTWWGLGAIVSSDTVSVHIVYTGSASRLTPKLEPLERTYTGTFRLGRSTTTYDAR